MTTTQQPPTTTRIHPHLKSFIRSIVATEFDIPQHPEDNWKEQLMTVAINRVIGQVGTVNSSEDYDILIDNTTRDLSREFVTLSQTIKEAIHGIPLELLRTKLTK